MEGDDGNGFNLAHEGVFVYDGCRLKTDWKPFTMVSGIGR